ncbi:hypothetical protein TEQG_08618 [Trichophyton equinum CBS 127.97]|uniref:Uncharacterized protein n=1 Tax=Trichophyton equinum (strain ATCC MYA-4606 / CBS 127.97) TaxID=559882 RepID=F2PM97_TRIEC|nr:hypothetical protein TEQG_08618 [Trichophyton equinum CBS 127.97]
MPKDVILRIESRLSTSKSLPLVPKGPDPTPEILLLVLIYTPRAEDIVTEILAEHLNFIIKLEEIKIKRFIYAYARIITLLFKITKGYKKEAPSLLINLEKDNLLISRDTISRAKSLKKLITKLEKARVA